MIYRDITQRRSIDRLICLLPLGVGLSLVLIAYGSPTFQESFANSSLSFDLSDVFRPYRDSLRFLGIVSLGFFVISTFLLLLLNGRIHRQPLGIHLLSFGLYFCIRDFLLATSASGFFLGADSFPILSIYLWGICLHYGRFLSSSLFWYTLRVILSVTVILSFFIFFSFAGSPAFFWGERFSGVFSHPQFAGLLFCISSLFFSLEFLVPRNVSSSLGRYRVITLSSCFDSCITFLLLTVSLFLLIQTGSRTALVAILISFSYLLLIALRTSSVRAKLVAAIFLVLLPPALFLWQAQSLFSGLRSFTFEDNSGRDYIWSALLSNFLRNPVFGSLVAPPYSESSYLCILSFGGLALFCLFSVYLYFNFLRPLLCVFFSWASPSSVRRLSVADRELVLISAIGL